MDGQRGGLESNTWETDKESVLSIALLPLTLLANSPLSPLVSKQRKKRVRELLAICSLQNYKGA